MVGFGGNSKDVPCSLTGAVISFAVEVYGFCADTERHSVRAEKRIDLGVSCRAVGFVREVGVHCFVASVPAASDPLVADCPSHHRRRHLSCPDRQSLRAPCVHVHLHTKNDQPMIHYM